MFIGGLSWQTSPGKNYFRQEARGLLTRNSFSLPPVVKALSYTHAILMSTENNEKLFSNKEKADFFLNWISSEQKVAFLKRTCERELREEEPLLSEKTRYRNRI